MSQVEPSNDGLNEIRMPRSNPLVRLAPQIIERRIFVVRGQRVMLDADLAQLYGIPTKVLNQGVMRNRNRFPRDFAFPLTLQEVTDLKSQFVTSSLTHGGRRKLPWVFTEQGVAMLSSVLRSPMAVRVNIEIMRAFVRLRRLLATPGEIVAQLTKLAETVELHDDQIRVIDEVLRKMMEPPPEAPKRRFGFHMPEPENDQAN
jgi:ORF6N domain